MIRLRPHLAAAAALLAVAHPAAAQLRTAEEVLRAVVARAQARMEGVQNYTLNVKSMGQSVVIYASRGPDGTFRVQSGGTDAMAGMVSQMTGWPDEMLLLLVNGLEQNTITPEDIARSRYEGVVSSSDGPAYRISADFSADSAADTDEDMPGRMVLDFDTATLLTRRMEAEMAAQSGTPGNMVVEFGDWRTVSGMPLPFRRHLVIRGLRGVVLGDDTANSTQVLAQARAKLAELPASEREAMRQMLDVMEGLVKRDEMVLDEIVTSVAVNQGPPPGITFAPRAKNP